MTPVPGHLTSSPPPFSLSVPADLPDVPDVEKISSVRKRVFESPSIEPPRKLCPMPHYTLLRKLNEICVANAAKERLGNAEYQFLVSLIHEAEEARRLISAALLQVLLPTQFIGVLEQCVGYPFFSLSRSAKPFIEAFSSSLWSIPDFTFELEPFIPFLKSGYGLYEGDKVVELLIPFILSGARHYNGKSPQITDFLDFLAQNSPYHMNGAVQLGLLSAVREGIYSETLRGDEGILEWFERGGQSNPQAICFRLYFRQHPKFSPYYAEIARGALNSAIARGAPPATVLSYFKYLAPPFVRVEDMREEDGERLITFAKTHLLEAAPLAFNVLVSVESPMWQVQKNELLMRIISECGLEDFVEIFNSILLLLPIPTEIGVKMLDRLISSNTCIQAWLKSNTPSKLANTLIAALERFKNRIPNLTERELLLHLLSLLTSNKLNALFETSLHNFIDFPFFVNAALPGKLKELESPSFLLIADDWPDFRLPIDPDSPKEGLSFFGELTSEYFNPYLKELPPWERDSITQERDDNWNDYLLLLYNHLSEPETIDLLRDNLEFFLNKCIEDDENTYSPYVLHALAILMEILKHKPVFSDLAREYFKTLLIGSIVLLTEEKIIVRAMRWFHLVGSIAQNAPFLFNGIQVSADPLIGIARQGSRSREERKRFLHSLANIHEANPLLISREALLKEFGFKIRKIFDP